MLGMSRTLEAQRANRLNYCLWSCKITTCIRPRGYKTFFMLNSIEHEILNAHKYKNIKTFGFLQALISLECYFFHPIHVKMPTVIDI